MVHFTVTELYEFNKYMSGLVFLYRLLMQSDSIMVEIHQIDDDFHLWKIYSKLNKLHILGP